MVVGGGAAGVFGAIRAKTVAPNLNVVVMEKGKPLSKVSGLLDSLIKSCLLSLLVISSLIFLLAGENIWRWPVQCDEWALFGQFGGNNNVSLYHLFEKCVNCKVKWLLKFAMK